MIPFTLEKLDYLLSSKQISGSLIAITFLIFFISLNYIIYFISAAAFVFTLYMLMVLYKYEKFGWLIGFAILMAASYALSRYSGSQTIFGVIMNYLPLLSFFLFCTVLKIQAGEWVSELEYERELRRQKAIEKHGKPQ